MVAFAMLFLSTLFVIRNGLPWKNTETSKGGAGGLLYEEALIEDLVKKDGDGDGVLDWEESLWGLDPAKAETTPGTPDIVVMNKLRAENGISTTETGTDMPAENLSETEKFSRELFSTVASLNQNGTLDQATLEAITESLSEKVRNSGPTKVYTLTDLKLSTDNSAAAVKKYNAALEGIYTKYPIAGKTLDIMDKFVIDEDTVDEDALEGLDPLIIKMENIIADVLKVSVPQSLAALHLETLNALERIKENLHDIRLYASDPILALKGITQYQTNVISLGTSSDRLKKAIAEKLSN